MKCDEKAQGNARSETDTRVVEAAESAEMKRRMGSKGATRATR